jgi:hypothetical protein
MMAPDFARQVAERRERERRLISEALIRAALTEPLPWWQVAEFLPEADRGAE